MVELLYFRRDYQLIVSMLAVRFVDDLSNEFDHVFVLFFRFEIDNRQRQSDHRQGCCVCVHELKRFRFKKES